MNNIPIPAAHGYTIIPGAKLPPDKNRTYRAIYDATKAAKQMWFGPFGQLYIFLFSGGLDHRASLARLAEASYKC